MTTKTEKLPATLNSLAERPDIKARFEKMLGARTGAFLTSLMQVVSSNELLKKADPISVLNGAATAASLDLPLSNQLGLAYLVPFNVKQPNGTSVVMAQFIIGYKGLINLAERTALYKTINALPIYEGQLVSENPLTGDYKFDFKKKSTKVIGYAAYFKLLSGFEKTIFWTRAEVLDHAKKYSKTYGKAGSAWTTEEEDMGCKTVLRQLIGKYGPVSVDYQRAEAVDEEVYPDISTAPTEYTDATYQPSDEEREKLTKLVEEHLASNNDVEALTLLVQTIDPGQYQDLIDKVQSKIETIQNKKGAPSAKA